MLRKPSALAGRIEDMQQPVALPAGLVEHPPGPQLCALLADLDTTQVSNHATVVLLRAWRRLR
ncbi:hypothetical protein SAMN05216207_11119, partial [Pseudonocardia ammonioxydans]